MTTDEYDAVVVGSGAGGGAIAYALCRAGFRVLVLEKGPRYGESDFFHDELAVCRRDFFVPGVLDEPQMVARDGGAAAPSSDGWISCCVGGGTVHMGGYFFRMHADDFRLRTRFGAVASAAPADWPIAYERMEPFYDEAERVIGVSGDARANPHEPRRAPYPLAPLAVHASAALIDAACGSLGLHAFPTPRAILSSDYAGRKACEYCGFCGSYGCEVGAKSSSLVSFLALAASTGRLTLRPRAMVSRVVAERGRAWAVTFLDERGAEQRATGRVIVLAASAIQTARLLLASDLANASGLVGKNLMFATVSAGFGRFPMPDPHWLASGRDWPFLDRSVQDLYIAERAGLPHAKAGTILFQLPHYNPIFQTERLARIDGRDGDAPAFGAELRRRMREFFHDTRTIEYETLSEFLPHDGCDVTLDPSVKDRFGLPVARVRIAAHPASLAASDLLAARARDVLAAAGATRVGAFREDRAYLALQCGTARMGGDPSRSVLDATGQAHDVRNLYVADGSGFPSSSGAPFTLTIMANALRVASHIVARGKRAEL